MLCSRQLHHRRRHAHTSGPSLNMMSFNPHSVPNPDNSSPASTNWITRHFSCSVLTLPCICSKELRMSCITAVTNNNDNHVFLILEAEAEAEAEAIDESRVFRLLVFHSLNGQSAHQ